jgi:hypothetical protein
VPPPPDRHVLGTRTSGTSRRVGSQSKHSQVPIRRRRDRAHRRRDAPHPPQRQGQGRRVLPRLPRLAIRCLPYVSWCTAGVCSHAGRVDAAYYSSADRSAVLDEYGIRIHELCILARMHIEAAMARLSRSDARQSPQPPKCVDRPMAWVRKGAIGAEGYPGYLKAGSCTCQPLGAEHGACAAVGGCPTQQGSMVCTVGSSGMCPSCICRTRVVQTELWS